MNVPELVVVVAGDPNVKYVGDGEWAYTCPGCGWWIVCFSKTHAAHAGAEHPCRASVT